MLEDSLFESQAHANTRRPFTLAIAVIAHIVSIGVLVLIPLLQTHVLALPPINLSLLTPEIKTSAPPSVPVEQPRIQKYTVPPPNVLTAPESIPSHIVLEADPAPPSIGLMPTGTGTGKLLADLLSTNAVSLAPSAPPQAAPELPPPPVFKKPEILRQGGNVQAAMLIAQVKPVYPALARQTRVQGIVVMEATIGKDGSVESLRVLSGHPLLNQAALDAVKEWRYRPTQLNGEPVEVLTTITVTFTMK